MAEHTCRDKKSNFNMELFLSICEKYDLSLEDLFKKDDEIEQSGDAINAIPIPEGASNGDMLLTMFDTATIYGIDKENDYITICIDNNFYQKFRYSWWNAPYEREEE